MSRFLRRIFSKINSVTPATGSEASSTFQIVGKDHLGNVYYEEPTSRPGGMRKTKRFYEPVSSQDFDKPIPPEWFAWLNYRREDPPTQEQIFSNIEDSELRKDLAAEIAKKFAKPDEPVKAKGSTNPFEKWPKRYQND